MPTEPDYQALPDSAVTKPKKGKVGKESRDAKAAKVLGKRICIASKALSEKLKHGDAYKVHIVGEAPKDAETPIAEAKKSIGEGWNKSTIPAHGMLCSVLTPNLIARKPTYINRARKSADERERAQGRIYTELAKVIERESDVHAQMSAALDDCYPNTVGWLFVDFDPERRLPIVRQVPCSRVLVDQETDGRRLHARHPLGCREAQYSGERRALARGECLGRQGYDFKEVECAWDDDDHESEPEIDEVPTKFAKLVLCTSRGTTLYRARRPLRRPRGRGRT